MEIFRVKNIGLSYAIEGSGNKVMLAFHGFGQTKASMKPLSTILKEEYTVYSFDLFFHGKSIWDSEKDLLTKDFWKEIIELFLKENKIDKFELVGFSMGGKFVLATLEAFPYRVEKTILIAPDGIKTSFWYSLATYPHWIRTLFQKTIEDPTIFQKMVRALKAMNLVDKGLLKFAETQMDTEEKRKRVYCSWMVFKAFQFDLVYLASLINQSGIDVEVFIGKYDKIIVAKNMQRLLKHVAHYKLEILDTGHNHLIPKVAEYYQQKEPPSYQAIIPYR